MLAIFFENIFIFLCLFVLSKLIYKKKKLHPSSKKQRILEKLGKYFQLENFKQEIEKFNQKKTKLNFYCEKLISEYYTKLTIFDVDYDLSENKVVIIPIDNYDLINTNFKENITLIANNGEKINFIINIYYNMDNYYQIILDKINDPIYIEAILYSKNNWFPEIKIENNLSFKNYENNSIPNLKRYNLINISRKDFYAIYNNHCSNKLNNESLKHLKKKNSLLLNFIVKNDKKIEGRIFEQNADSIFEDFNEKEINLLKDMEGLVRACSEIKKNLASNLSMHITYSYGKKIKEKENIVKGIVSKIINANFYNRYYNKNVKKELLNLIDSAILIRYIEEKGMQGVRKFLKYLHHKKEILSDKNEFTNFEKLMISINIQYLVIKVENFEFVKLYELPESSPFVNSEKLLFDIIKKLDENSNLYFFYLQINSSAGKDYISLKKWYKINYIPLMKIKSLLFYNRYPFFFVFQKVEEVVAFVNPQNMIINYNVDPDVGYIYTYDMLNEESDDNTFKLLIIKFHESVHSKFDCGKNNIKSPRYLLNSNFETIDVHYDLFVKYKKGNKYRNSEKKGKDIGEEGWAFELFIYGSIIITDILLKNDDLSKFINIDLYTKDNFDELKKLIKEYLEKKSLKNKVSEKKKELDSVKNLYLKEDESPITKNSKDFPRTRMYFFYHYPLDANY